MLNDNEMKTIIHNLCFMRIGDLRLLANHGSNLIVQQLAIAVIVSMPELEESELLELLDEELYNE